MFYVTFCSDKNMPLSFLKEFLHFPQKKDPLDFFACLLL